MLGTILLATAVSVAMGFVLAQYLAVDVPTSLIIFPPNDCYLDWATRLGTHCFSDYSITVSIGTASNPWDPYPLYLPPDFKPTHFNYVAAGMVPQVAFGLLGEWLSVPLAALFGYLAVLTIAVMTPAVWAARGARGLERVVVFVACGAAAIPAWVVIDRGNSVGFAVPIVLVFLVALCRQRWLLVAIMVVLAALVKPQFVVLAVALFAVRQWRTGGIAVGGAIVSNLGAYALWPRDFPRTIMQSIHNTVGYSNGAAQAVMANSNVSFGKGLLAIPDGAKAAQTGGTLPADFLAGPRSLIGYLVLLLVVVAVVTLGSRIPPVMTGIVLLAVASLFPALSNPYYLVFVLPVAAIVIRDPNGPPGTGIFDRQTAVGGPRRALGVMVGISVALCIAQIALPGPVREIGGGLGQNGPDSKIAVVTSTIFLAPILWLFVITAILVSYGRRPADLQQPPEESLNPADRNVTASEPIAEFSPQSLP